MFSVYFVWFISTLNLKIRKHLKVQIFGWIKKNILTSHFFAIYDSNKYK